MTRWAMFCSLQLAHFLAHMFLDKILLFLKDTVKFYLVCIILPLFLRPFSDSLTRSCCLQMFTSMERTVSAWALGYGKESGIIWPQTRNFLKQCYQIFI